ncbi:DUF2285 domain-containing protein [Hyphomonas sp.]|mgnify:CR=1 FL=1|uniref:DNA -binding domain-containing protein n=1 Tax=Hyphomonas sp. TaxID=87 RepID=UPI0025C040EF|nr:DUF2285 domain-containing protein [Hyphomonas sp.]
MKTYTLNSDGVLKRYDYLWRMSADRWAWEYLRRNPDFLHDAECRRADDVSERMAPCAPIRLLRSRISQTLAERWGLMMMPDPQQNGFEADVFWSRAAHPDQVEVHCSPRSEEEACGIWDRTVPFCRITHLTDQQGREFLLLRGNGCVVQVRCSGLSLLGMEKIRMKLTISDMDAYERKLKAQRDALEVWGQDYDQQTPLWTKRTQILRDGLIALDCLELGMSRRDIATVLYGKERVESEWPDDRASMRDALKYLVSKAEGLRDGGYLVELLGGRLGPYQTAA